MANLNAPKGFVPSRIISGGPWDGGFNTYVIPAADAIAYNVGDSVKSVANGDANGMMAVQKCTGVSGEAVRGVIIGFAVAPMYGQSLLGTNLDLTIQNIPAVKAKAYYAMVVDNPFVLFELQDDGLAALTATSCNKNAAYTVTNPTLPLQNSQTVLQTSSVAVTQALPLKLLGLIQRDDNAFGLNAKWLVKFNQHELLGNTAGV